MQGGGLGVGEGSKGRVGVELLESRGDVVGCCYDGVGGAGCGHGEFLGEPGNSVNVLANGLGFPHPGLVAAVGVKVGTDIPAIKAVGGPALAIGGLLMGDDVGAWGSNGIGVEIIQAVDLGPGGEVGVDSACSEQVESQVGLGDKVVPETEWKVGVTGAEAGDEVVLVGLNGTLCNVGSMHARWGSLVDERFLGHELLECIRAFVVKLVQLGAEASVH